MKASTVEREAMKRTQPRMCRVIDGLKGGKGRMVVVEPAETGKRL